MSRILVVEDEAAIHRMLCLNLGIAGYRTASAYDGMEALALLDACRDFSLALVDVMLPGLDGFALLEPLHKARIPVVFLTARGDLASRLEGLTGGAEDYIVKPFDMPELLVRIEKVLSRHAPAAAVVRCGELELNTEERVCRKGGAPVALTPIEFSLLLHFIRHKNVALTRSRLLYEVWGDHYEGETRTVDVHVAQVRKKTGLRIVTVPKTGYRLEDAP